MTLLAPSASNGSEISTCPYARPGDRGDAEWDLTRTDCPRRTRAPSAWKAGPGLLSGAALGVVRFRRRPERGEDEEQTAGRNADLVVRFEATGGGLVSSTRLLDRYLLVLEPSHVHQLMRRATSPPV